jgi:predicted DNA-binding helix-hairpin-helix protein
MEIKRVYYSGYVPISNDNRLPAVGTPVPVVREHRLYQADWLMRFYGFKVNEIVSFEQPHLDLDIDPKMNWALKNMHLFPIDINKADLEMILRVPGIGVQSAHRIINSRKFSKLNWEHLKKMGLQLNKAKHFIVCSSPDFERKDYTSMQLKQIILSNGNSKFSPNFSPQLKLF